MTKDEIVDYVVRNAGQNASVKFIDDVVNLVFESLSNALSCGESITIRGFGTFDVRDRATRVGRNPRTGEPVCVPEYKAVVFRPCNGLKNHINNKD